MNSGIQIMEPDPLMIGDPDFFERRLKAGKFLNQRHQRCRQSLLVVLEAGLLEPLQF